MVPLLVALIFVAKYEGPEGATLSEHRKQREIREGRTLQINIPVLTTLAIDTPYHGYSFEIRSSAAKEC